MAEAARDLHSDHEYYIGFDDGVEGRPCHATSLAYVRGYKEGRSLSEMPGGSKREAKEKDATADSFR